MSTYTAYCENCNDLVEYTITGPAEECVTVRNRQIPAKQMHAHCNRCGAEVSPDEVIDYNVSNAHDAYRIAVGSITSDEIRSILDKYDIGAQPLSKLLGWGDNSIERQIKHTVPDLEHARRLRELEDPKAMKKLLFTNGNSIPTSAYKKAMNAVNRLLTTDSAPITYTSHTSGWKIERHAIMLAR